MHKLINNRTIQVSCLPVFGVGGLFVIALIAYTDAISIYFKFLSQTEWSPPHEFLLSYYYLIVNSGYIYDYYVPVIILSALGISTHFSPTKTFGEPETQSSQVTSPVQSVMSNSVTPWTAACQASLSISNFWSLLKLMSVMPSNHLILCHPLLLLSSIFPSSSIFSNESVLCIKWPKYWSLSFSISPSNEY